MSMQCACEADPKGSVTTPCGVHLLWLKKETLRAQNSLDEIIGSYRQLRRLADEVSLQRWDERLEAHKRGEGAHPATIRDGAAGRLVAERKKFREIMDRILATGGVP